MSTPLPINAELIQRVTSPLSLSMMLQAASRQWAKRSLGELVTSALRSGPAVALCTWVVIDGLMSINQGILSSMMTR